MEKAKQARTENEAGGELDSIKLAVVSAMAKGTYGMVELENLENEIKNLDGINVVAGTGENAGEFVVIGKQKKYVVSPNGQVKKFSGLSISSINLQIFEGETATLTATVSEEIENKTVTWTAMNGAILIVNNTETTSTTTEGSSSVTIKALSGMVTVAVDGEETKTCMVTVKTMPTIGTAEDVEQYGNKVVLKNTTTAYSAGGINTWRLFYKDREYTYLISDILVGSYNLNVEYTDSTTSEVKPEYENGSKVSAVGKGLNYGLISKNSFSSNNRRYNINATAWLTDISDVGPWASYKGLNVDYAIGGPTIELFVASYNAVNGSGTSCTPDSVGGYTFSGNNLSDDRHNIWAGKGRWWLASPREISGNYYCIVVTDDGLTIGAVSGNHPNTYAVRPLLMIPSSTFENKYVTINDTDS